MSDYLADVKKYDSGAGQDAVDSIVKYCGIALRSRDASLVSCSDQSELDTVRDGFCKKKLELSPEDAEKAITATCEEMKAARQKSRVTFYYLVAKHSGTLGKL